MASTYVNENWYLPFFESDDPMEQKISHLCLYLAIFPKEILWGGKSKVCRRLLPRDSVVPRGDLLLSICAEKNLPLLDISSSAGSYLKPEQHRGILLPSLYYAYPAAEMNFSHFPSSSASDSSSPLLPRTVLYTRTALRYF